MRPFILSLCAATLLVGAARAQAPGNGSGAPQIPYGQTFKDFQYPIYQNGQLSYIVSAVSAKGTTLNRAETTDLKIELYENGKVTTTITSPKADLYLNDRVMRTKNTVLIERTDMEASAQSCDFNLNTKKYLLRNNVKVVLKNFDSGTKTSSHAPSTSSASPSPQPARPAPSTPSSPPPLTMPNLSLTPASPNPARNNTSLLDSPGAYSNPPSTNVAPTSPSGPVTP